MQYKNIKDNVLKLIDLKQKTSELIKNIYHESEEIQLCIYDDNSVFCENPLGFETLAKLFKKRIQTCDVKIKGKYPIKKYFEYKGIEFFCLYLDKKERGPKAQKIANIIGKFISIMKNVFLFIWKIIKVIEV